jgi:hypothetical protein
MRAAVYAIRTRGERTEHHQPLRWELHGEYLAISGSRGEVVRLPISDLAGRTDA